MYKYDLQNAESFISVRRLLQSGSIHRTVLLCSYSENKNHPDDMKRSGREVTFLN
jgi:hypothetical protein